MYCGHSHNYNGQPSRSALTAMLPSLVCCKLCIQGTANVSNKTRVCLLQVCGLLCGLAKGKVTIGPVRPLSEQKKLDSAAIDRAAPNGTPYKCAQSG